MTHNQNTYLVVTSQGSGKTRRANMLMKRLGLHNLIDPLETDEWPQNIPAGSLVLADSMPANVPDGIIILSLVEAKQLATESEVLK